MTLIAPAGYGETAALSRQLTLLPAGCVSAWVTADAEDDLPRLIRCLAASLEPYDPPWRVAPEALAELTSRERSLREVADTLANTLGEMPVVHGVIALDDMHSVRDPRVLEFLGLLVRCLPDRWTVAIASRAEPLIGLVRLRLQREVAEFTRADLGFAQEEIQLLCDSMEEGDDGSLARRLQERTQGWVAGICLILDAMADGKQGTRAEVRLSERRMFEYLAAEVFEQMPRELQDFLLRCSVLAELTPDRCAAVSGNSRAAVLLDEIERRGLFVTQLDSEEFTLRLHDLFRDFLDARLRRQFGSELPLLLHRAGDTEPDPVRKVALFLRAGDVRGAEQVLGDWVPRLLAEGQSIQLARLVAMFPPEIQKISPQLAYAAGLIACHQLDDAAVVTHMRPAAEGFDRLNEPREAQHARIHMAFALVHLGQVEESTSLAKPICEEPLDQDAAVLCELFWVARTSIFGPLHECGRHLSRMVDLLGDDASEELWFRCIPKLYVLTGLAGCGAPLMRFVQGARRVAKDEGSPLFAAANVLEAWQLLWQGDFETAHAVIERARMDSAWLGHPRSIRIPLLRASATYSAIQGDRAGVDAVIEAFLADAPPVRSAVWTAVIYSFIGRFAAALDDTQGLRDALDTVGKDRILDMAWWVQVVYRILWARCALFENRNEEALEDLRVLHPLTNEFGQVGISASACVYHAVSELRAGFVEEAWRAIEPVVALTRSTGEVWGVLMTGPTMLTELANAAWGDHASPEEVAIVRQWLDLAMTLRGGFENAPTVRESDPTVLSAREIDVLRLIATGQSNKLIARALNLSPHTIKRHVARILERLDLSSRVAAAAWYLNQPGPSVQEGI